MQTRIWFGCDSSRLDERNDYIGAHRSVGKEENENEKRKKKKARGRSRLSNVSYVLQIATARQRTSRLGLGLRRKNNVRLWLVLSLRLRGDKSSFPVSSLRRLAFSPRPKPKVSVRPYALAQRAPLLPPIAIAAHLSGAVVVVAAASAAS